jgi:hypothetical protein
MALYTQVLDQLKKDPMTTIKPEQSRTVQILVQATALVVAIGAIVTSLVTACTDKSKDQAAYEKMREFYNAVRNDAIRQNSDNIATRSEVDRIEDEKTQGDEALRKELDEVRKKVRLPAASDGSPVAAPSLAPVGPVTLPKSLDDVPAMPKR